MVIYILFCALFFTAVVNLDNSVVDLETLQALYENVSRSSSCVICRVHVCAHMWADYFNVLWQNSVFMQFYMFKMLSRNILSKCVVSGFSELTLNFCFESYSCFLFWNNSNAGVGTNFRQTLSSALHGFRILSQFSLFQRELILQSDNIWCRTNLGLVSFFKCSVQLYIFNLQLETKFIHIHDI